MTILNKGGGRLELNALFIQPTYGCRMNCPGCYVKAGKHTSADLDLLFQVFKVFYEGKRALARQITISLDTVSSVHDLEVVFFRELMKFKMMFDNTTEGISRSVVPEIHVTSHSGNSIFPYVKHSSIMHQLDLVSLSEFDPDLEVPNGKIALNHMIPKDLNSSNVKEWIAYLEKCAHVLEHIYLLHFKEPMGLATTPATIDRIAGRMTKDLAAWKAIMRYGSEGLKKKVKLDGCLIDAFNHKKTGYTCMSNVSRFAIWPNGAVSGCPYSVRRKANETLGDVLADIKAQQKRSDFREICTLPNGRDHAFFR